MLYIKYTTLLMSSDSSNLEKHSTGLDESAEREKKSAHSFTAKRRKQKPC